MPCFFIILPRYSVGARVGRGHLDAADTSSFFDCDLDVTCVTPRSAPGVLYKPVFLARGSISAITDSEDGVVKVSAALCGVQNTALV